MVKKYILIIEDDEGIRDLISSSLTKDGYATAGVETGEEGVLFAQSKVPCLILLDLTLPGMDGLEVCRALKRDERTMQIPIILIAERGEESDVVMGLEIGADDFVAKPPNLKALASRVKAVLRRNASVQDLADAPIKVHDLLILPGEHKVVLDGKAMDLTFTEFRILHCLASKPGWVLTRYQIVDAVRGEGYPVTDRAVDVQVVGLRKKLGEYGEYIETVRGVGYRFRE